ncbi:MAG: thiamine pyrophosphate-dependent dehydrogenase E1 component subunit alpha [Thermogemmatispora sp.]|uniref:thiamine pyrophosphate-dependent dehydrogenase E1 component subunit alpha n=1 Tax=Thermogemmatispora sp. TaxID=1968838 RepID=UPI00263859C7|nr:thiamine pyrophosphate-dependent dehydrogenase E1 component subunit alpha [Thermogemmatispora sp.]MBX5457859.1 thiamine pyrophosphate-dependent dehydrogenase E1 component subunit alpha [Thermogemmatispora sp.]
MELATTQPSLSTTQLRDLYQRMLLTRLVDGYCWQLHQSGRIGFVASCRGHEAAQVGSAACIRPSFDFTLPYYRDLGVVLTLGMTPYEIFRTYLQGWPGSLTNPDQRPHRPIQHWGYHKHNMISGPVPVATQILHAAGIAFACKLRKSSAVAIAYCGDGATAEPDFLEGLTFAAQQRLPVLFICEQDCSLDAQVFRLSPARLPSGLTYRCVDGSDIREVYASTSEALELARAGQGPILLEMLVTRGSPEQDEAECDPLSHCRRLLESSGAWDEVWYTQLAARLRAEVEQALEDALRDSHLSEPAEIQPANPAPQHRAREGG